MIFVSFPRRSILLFFVVLTLFVTSCGKSDEKDDSNSQEGSFQTLPEVPTTADPYVVTEVIDVAYVERVLTEIEEVRGAARREIWGNYQFSHESQEKLRSIYDEPYLSFALGQFSDGSMKDHPDYKPNPGPAKVIIEKLVTASADCIFTVVSYNDNVNRVNSQPVYKFGVTLRSAERNDWNHTGWKKIESISADQTTPENLCAK